MPAETTDRRAMLRQAMERSTRDEEETTEVEESAAEEPEDAAAPAEEEPAAEAEAAPEGETAEQKAERERDDKGRFAAKGKDAPAPKAKEKPAPVAAAPVQPAAAQPAKVETPAAPAVRPPQSWTPAEREQWAKLTPEAQRAVLRTEQETRRVLQENAQLRKVSGDAQQFRQQIDGFVRPFEGIFRAQGVEPMQGVANVVQTYAALHYAPAPQKAAILAGLISQFSSVDDVNAALQGQPAQPQAQQYRPPPQQAPADPRALIREELQSLQQQAALSRAERDLETFQATNPEFLDSPGIWENMQTILDAGAQRGRNLTYQQAYDLALKMDPEIQGVLEQRAKLAAVVAPSATAPTARARTAAATVRSRPAPAVGAQPDPNDRRAMLQRAMESSRS